MDLNLVRVFVAIYESRSLTSAADRLYVTQSAVSQSLSRLRSSLDNPLFQRRGRFMEPTALAKEIFPAFRDALLGIDATMDKLTAFDPQHSTRQFRIALSELGEVGWLANIVADIRREAPQVRVRSFLLQQHDIDEWLHRGLADVAIAPAEIPGDLERTPIKTQTYCVVMAKDHAAAYTEPAVVTEPYASTLSRIMQSPDLIAVAPRSLAEGWVHCWPIVVMP